jgi:hypothetical protein
MTDELSKAARSRGSALANALDEALHYGDELGGWLADIDNSDRVEDDVAEWLKSMRPYFADRADVTGETDSPMTANEALRVLTAIDAALEAK